MPGTMNVPGAPSVVHAVYDFIAGYRISRAARAYEQQAVEA